MRDILLLLFVFCCLGLTLRYPFVGVLTWAWFSLMTPHQMAYGTFGIPLNLVIAAVTIFALIYSREVQKFRLNGVTILLLLLLFWQTVAQQMSIAPEYSGEFYSRFFKTILFVLICAQMITDKLRFHALVWILVGGIGFFAAKGAIFTLLTIGQYRVQGLENTVLEDNNHFGIAAATILPIMIYLRGQLSLPLMRNAMLALIMLTLLAIIGTHSRGALVTMVAFAGLLWWKSSHKASLGLVGIVALVPAIMFMPAKWIERMKTIQNAGGDESFIGRLQAWEINWKLALENPITGVGLRNSYLEEVASLVVPQQKAEAAKAAHSIYFEFLGGSGFVGLFLFLLLLGYSYLKARQIEKSSREDIPEWKKSFSRYAQMSLVIFCIGGASTSMEMWDGYLIIIALIAALSHQAVHETNRRGYARSKKRRIQYQPQSSFQQH